MEQRRRHRVGTQHVEHRLGLRSGQSGCGADAMATPETQTPVVEERKVDQFAAAFVAVQDIQAQATQQLSTAKDEQQATQVKASAEQKMIEAVQREGLEVEEFNRIADLMTTDLSLRSKVVEKVEKRRKG